MVSDPDSSSPEGGKVKNEKTQNNTASLEQTRVVSSWSDHLRVKVRRWIDDGSRWEWKQIESAEEFKDVLKDSFGIDSSSPKTIDLIVDAEDEDVHIIIHKKRLDSTIFQKISNIPGLQEYREVSISPKLIKISKPFGPLYHDRIRHGNRVLGINDPAELKEEKDRDELLALIELCQHDLVMQHHEEISGNKVKFEELWKLYFPGNYVVMDELKSHSSIRKIESVSYDGAPSEPDTEFKIVCTEISHDGTRFGERRSEITQEYFAGSKEVSDMIARPIDPHSHQNAELNMRLSDRGLRFRDYCKLNEVRVMDHEGFAFLNGNESQDDEGETRIAGRVVIDPHVFQRAPEILRHYDFVRRKEEFKWATSTEPGKMSKELELQCARCSAKLPVFSLLEDQWYVVAVDDLKKPWADHERTDDSWKKVIGNERHQKKLGLLYHLVQQWSKADKANSKTDGATGQDGDKKPGVDVKSSTTTVKDNLKKGRSLAGMNGPGASVVGIQPTRRFTSLGSSGRPTDITGPDKGQGLIIMLHGPSGVGKTMTAECLADSIKKPLYRIDLAKISGGTRYGPSGRPYMTTMESEIERIFQNAQAWKAILLLDEAEAIMMERSPDKMEQNSWVSAFLRKVEYYKGILILTTNMIHLIDPAFESRVTFAVKYEKIEPDTRREIWYKFIDRMDTSNITEQDKNSLKAKVRSQWVKQPLNGRQIRNICHAAEILAKAGPGEGLGESLEYYIQELFEDTKEFVGQIVQAREAAEEQSLRDIL